MSDELDTARRVVAVLVSFLIFTSLRSLTRPIVDPRAYNVLMIAIFVTNCAWQFLPLDLALPIGYVCLLVQVVVGGYIAQALRTAL